ncbi:MAG: hypothetical protein NWE89_13830 [Candidatus Bathyarchaeota archaeon]|nr:hypothetical protein [Candidatus Bathyarchaeota archaeon]
MDNYAGVQPAPLAQAQEHKPHIEVPIEAFASEYGIPINEALCLIGKTEEDTNNRIKLLKKLLQRGNKTPGKRSDDKFTSAVTNRELVDLVKAYFIYDCNATVAEGKLPHTRKTITKYWKMFGLNLTMGAPTKNENDDQNEVLQLQREIMRLKKLLSEKPLKGKDDDFLGIIKGTKEWIASHMKDCVSAIHGLAINIENTKKDIRRKEKKIEKLDGLILERHCFFVDCLEQAMWYIENTEDICKNRESASCIADYGSVYKSAKKKDIVPE